MTALFSSSPEGPKASTTSTSSGDSLTYDNILRALIARGVPDGAGDVMAMTPERVASLRWRCPVCNSSDGLAIKRGDKVDVVTKCWSAGCEHDAILDALGIEHSRAPSAVTLELLADYLGVPMEWLEAEGWCDDTYTDKQGVRHERVAIPYMVARTSTSDARSPGDIVWRYRVGLSTEPRFAWITRPKANVKENGLLYAAHDIAHCAGAAIFLGEGESDALILKKGAGYYAVGLPGASMWCEETHAPLFANVAQILVPIERDAGGARLLNALRSSSLAPKVRILQLHHGKDVRDLYNSCAGERPSLFKEWIDEAVASALTIEQFGDIERQERAMHALLNAGDIPKSTSRLELILATIESNGLVGERAATSAAVLTYVSCIPRKGTANLIIKGDSSGGKSYVEEHAREHFPESFYLYLTNASAKALYYLPPDSLKHKVLVLAEATGLSDYKGESSELAQAIREIQTAGRLDYVTVMIGDHGPESTHIHQDGPTALIVTTTAIDLHPENETRALSVEIDDTPSQTRAVLDVIGNQFAGLIPPTDKTTWHSFFEWLRLTYMDQAVVIPFAPQVTRLIPEIALRLRRDVTTFFNYVCAHALLHADIRERDEHGNIIATLDDYEVVHRLLGQRFTENLDSVASDVDIETVEAVERIIAQKSQNGGLIPAIHVTYMELAEELGVQRTTALRRAKHPLKAGWLVNTEKNNNRPATLALGAPLPSEVHALLPTVEQLKGAMK